MMSRKLKIIESSNSIAKELGLTLDDKELNYGRGIGRADNHCIQKSWSIIFEIEFSQRHPEMNVIKIWRYLDQNPQKKIFLIQHITDTTQVSPNRIELCEWFGAKMKKDLQDQFDYFLIRNKADTDMLAILKAKIESLQ